MKKKTAHRVRTHHAPHFYVIFAVLMIFAGAFAALVATKVIGQSSNQIYACAQKQSGSLRLVSSGSQCSSSEVAVSWNEQGPQGPTGPAGVSQFNGLPYSCYDCNLSPFANKFAGKDFSSAQLLGCNFINVDLTGVIFKNGNLDQCVFTGSNLTNADLSSLTNSYGNNNMGGLDFKGSNLTGANFSNTTTQYAHFQNANLQNTNFSNMYMLRADFTDAQNMSSANVSGVKWNGVTCPDGSNSDSNGNTCVGHF